MSFEPLLGPIEELFEYFQWEQLHWVIAGGESGPKRRTSKIDWFRSLRDQCQGEGVPFFLKQMEINGRIIHMPELDGKVWDEKP